MYIINFIIKTTLVFILVVLDRRDACSIYETDRETRKWLSSPLMQNQLLHQVLFTQIFRNIGFMLATEK